MKDIKDVYNNVTKNTEKMTIKELDKAFRKLGFQPQDHEMRNVQKEIDQKERELKAGDKKPVYVDFEWFTKIMADKMADADTTNNLIRAFKTLDADGSGSIDADEFRAVCRDLGEGWSEKDLDAMIKEVDENNDGVISEKEFIHMMKRKDSDKGELAANISKLEDQIRRFVKKKELIKKYKGMKKHLKNMFENISFENEKQKDAPFRDKIVIEKFDNPAFTALYSDVWELLQIFLK
jgi:Ca2+-binding EF-hand superfamily protein